MFGVKYGRYDYISQKPNYDNYRYEISLDELDKNLESILIDIFGNEFLEENLRFITTTLNNHQKQYQDRPIYFLK